MSSLVPINESLNSSTDTKKKDFANKGTDTNNLCSSTYTKFLITTAVYDEKKGNFEEAIKQHLSSREQGLINMKNIQILKKQNDLHHIKPTHQFNQHTIFARHNRQALISLKKPNGLYNPISSDVISLEKVLTSDINSHSLSKDISRLASNSNDNMKQLPTHVLLSMPRQSDMRDAHDQNPAGNDLSNQGEGIRPSLKSNFLTHLDKRKLPDHFSILKFKAINKEHKGNADPVNIKSCNYKGVTSRIDLSNECSLNSESSPKMSQRHKLHEVYCSSPAQRNLNPILGLHIKKKIKKVYEHLLKMKSKRLLRIGVDNKESGICSNEAKNRHKIIKSPFYLGKYIYDSITLKISKARFLNNSPLLNRTNKSKLQPLSPSSSSIIEPYNPLRNNSIKNIQFQRLT